MRTQSYAEFSLGLHQRLKGQRVPITGTIEVTRRCPLSCLHCYNNLPMGDREERLGELSREEHYRILDEIVEAGCLWLLFTGGEIFARKDFLDIYTYAKRKGLLITLFTNGTLITSAIADHLARFRPFAIEITLYGRTRETYERLTGVPGSFDRCMRGIRALTERRLPLKLKTVAVSVNVHEIEEMKRFAEEELGLEFKFDAMMNPRIDCSHSPLAVRLSPEEVVALDVRDPKRMEEWKRFAAQFNGPVHSPGQGYELYHCGGGMNAFAIDPQGKMSICTLSHRDVYDLRTGSFREGWESFLHGVRKRSITRLTKCTKCHIKAMCGMCPANGELENEDPESPVDFLCRVAHLRARAIGFAVPPHGECEYCEEGTSHEELAGSLKSLGNSRNGSRISGAGKRKLSLAGNQSPVSFGSRCSGGACASCGTTVTSSGS